MRFSPTSFRPVFGRVLSIIVTLISATGIAGFIASGDPVALARYCWPLLLLVALAFALFWFPRVDVAEHAVTVRNVFSTARIPWPAIERVDTKYALTIDTPEGRVSVWASPAPGRYGSQVSRTTDAALAARAAGADPRPGDLLETPSGAVAFVIRQHWEDLREDGLLAAGYEPGSMTRTVHVRTIILLAVLTLATVLGFVL